MLHTGIACTVVRMGEIGFVGVHILNHEKPAIPAMQRDPINALVRDSLRIPVVALDLFARRNPALPGPTELLVDGQAERSLRGPEEIRRTQEFERIEALMKIKR